VTRPQDVPRDPMPEWDADFPERKRRAVAAANRMSDDDLAAHDVPILTHAVLDLHAAHYIVPRFDLKWNQERVLQVPGSLESLTPRPMQIEFNTPMEGAGLVLFRVPNHGIHSGGNNAHPAPSNGDFPAWHASVTLTLHAENNAAWEHFEEYLRLTWEEWEKKLSANVKAANEMIEEHQADLESTISSIIKERRVRVVALRSAAANLSIPLRATAKPTIAVPISARLLTVAQVEQSRASGVPEPALAEGIAGDLIYMITSFGRALERLPKTADRLAGEDEEGIRDILLFILNANYGGLATGETFIGAGKSDILLRWRDKDAFIAECKFWHGESKFKLAIDQLLSYTVWRDTRIALILFIRDRADISAIVNKAIASVKRHERYLSTATTSEADESPEFLLASTSDDRRAIRLTLLTVAIPHSA
jgi:hypothetical protein